MQRGNKLLVGILIILFSIPTFFYCNISIESISSIQNQNRPFVASSNLLNYGQFCYDYIHTNSNENISWSFSSLNPNVSIPVIAMDFSNFSLFNSAQPNFDETLSPGNLTTDNGTFSPNYPDIWYIVYWNNDSDVQSTTIIHNASLLSINHDITITSPNNSSSWETSSSHQIYWTSIENISYVTISLYKDGVLSFIVINNLFNNGSYNWTIPKYMIPGNSYEIAIKDANNSTINYYSNFFSIITGKSITITNPTYYVKWNPGSSYHIYWSSTGNISNVNIYLYENGMFYSTIILNAYNDGSYFWTLPSNLPESYYYEIKIEDISNSSIYTFSDSFYVVNPSSSGSNIHSSYSGMTVIWIALGSFLFIIIIALYVYSRSKPNPYILNERDINNTTSQKSFNSINEQQTTKFSEQPLKQKVNKKATTKYPAIICPSCGTMVERDARFCPECGYMLTWKY